MDRKVWNEVTNKLVKSNEALLRFDRVKTGALENMTSFASCQEIKDLI